MTKKLFTTVMLILHGVSYHCINHAVLFCFFAYLHMCRIGPVLYLHMWIHLFASSSVYLYICSRQPLNRFGQNLGGWFPMTLWSYSFCFVSKYLLSAWLTVGFIDPGSLVLFLSSPFLFFTYQLSL